MEAALGSYYNFPLPPDGMPVLTLAESGNQRLLILLNALMGEVSSWRIGSWRAVSWSPAGHSQCGYYPRPRRHAAGCVAATSWTMSTEVGLQSTTSRLSFPSSAFNELAGSCRASVRRDGVLATPGVWWHWANCKDQSGYQCFFNNLRQIILHA